LLAGLPDLYDVNGPGYGQGLGSYSLMANSWGFDGTQNYPPLMDAWSKIRLGWVDPVPISLPGTYAVGAAAETPQVYMITNVCSPQKPPTDRNTHVTLLIRTLQRGRSFSKFMVRFEVANLSCNYEQTLHIFVS
jgi:M6 family metalloprotease-like protein